MTREEIIHAIKNAGIVGAGGAGFPTHVKLNAKAQTVIANGAECEPLIHANQYLLMHQSDKILRGLKHAMAATGADEGYICLKRKYTDAVERMTQAVCKLNDARIKLFLLDDFYPVGDEQVLVNEVTGRIVPEGGIPLNVKTVVVNVETLVNITQAVDDQEPVTEKYITVTGAVNKPFTAKVPIGMSMLQLIELAHGTRERDYEVIDGGPMMGKLVRKEAVVTKTTSGFIVLPAEHILVRQKQRIFQTIARQAKAVCCNCRACTDNCPRYLLGHSLEPHRLMQMIGTGSFIDDSVLTKAFLCSECGVCDTFACTMGLSPRRINAELKRELALRGYKNPHHRTPSGIRCYREFRRVPVKRLIARLGLSNYDVEAPFENASPKIREVFLPFRQHIGVPTRPIVHEGDYVSRGALIAAIPEQAPVGANLHASLEGMVAEIAVSGIRIVAQEQEAKT